MGGPGPRIWAIAFTLAALFHAAAAAFLFRQDSESGALPAPNAREFALNRMGAAASPNPASHSAEVLDARMFDPSDPDTGPAPEEVRAIAPEPAVPLDAAEVAGVLESATEAPVGETALVPPAPAEAATAPPDPSARDIVPEPAVLIAANSTASAPVPAQPVPVETIDTAEEPLRNADTPQLAEAVPNETEAAAEPTPEEAGPIPPEPAVPPGVAEVAEILVPDTDVSVEEAASVPPAPVEETVSAPAVPATTANPFPVPASPARDVAPEAAVLVTARGSARVHDAAQPLPAELVGAIEETVARSVSIPPASASTSQPSNSDKTRGKLGSGDEIAEGLQPADGVDLAGIQAAYLVQVQAWLARHKKYPRGAKTRGHTGTALLYFAIERDGRVRNFDLRKSTGHALLDREVRAMIERAQPLPRIPEEIRREHLELLVPIEFVLR